MKKSLYMIIEQTDEESLWAGFDAKVKLRQYDPVIAGAVSDFLEERDDPLGQALRIMTLRHERYPLYHKGRYYWSNDMYTGWKNRQPEVGGDREEIEGTENYIVRSGLMPYLVQSGGSPDRYRDDYSYATDVSFGSLKHAYSALAEALGLV